MIKGSKVLSCEEQFTGVGIFILEKTVCSGGQRVLIK